ncbi:MAG: hypothetical protein GY795_37255 [Desulfobacterales bacterium]|nr:hypothetical protein [Desulfobacterales bacterium]
MNKFIKQLRQNILLILIIIIFSAQGVYAESLFVFYPTPQRPHVLRQKMSEVFPSNIEIKVYGRYSDFEKKTRTASPDAVITKFPVIRQLSGYSVKMNGSRGGSTDESYVFLSIDEKIDPGNIKGMKIGVVGILGRKQMNQFVSNYFKAAPKLKRVLKIEDLLQLLTFKMVKAILIPECHVSFFKKRSELNFVVTPVPNMQTGIVSLAVKDENSTSSVAEIVKKMNNDIMNLLGIDKWEQK